MSGLDPIKKQQLTQMDAPSSVNSAPNTDPEAEYVQLPSQGKYYTGEYQGLTQLKVRKLNWEDEDILTTRSYYDNGTLFTEILKNCIVDENRFKPEMLIDVDKDAILWWLRIGAFGQNYTVTRTCPNCKAKSEQTWDLGSFEMPDLDEKYAEEVEKNGFVTITLPVSKLKVKVAVPSIGKETELYKKLKAKKEKAKYTKDFNITGKLMASIKEAYSLDEQTSYKGHDDLLVWLRSAHNGGPIPLVDSRYIQRVAKEIDFNVNTKKDITCSECDHTEEGVEMPMTINFFWPEYTGV